MEKETRDNLKILSCPLVISLLTLSAFLIRPDRIGTEGGLLLAGLVTFFCILIIFAISPWNMKIIEELVRSDIADIKQGRIWTPLGYRKLNGNYEENIDKYANGGIKMSETEKP
jgi:hypothetical protein